MKQISKGKILLLVLAVSMVFTGTLYTDTFVHAHEHHHDHAHDSMEKTCLICLLISITNNFFKYLKLIPLAFSVVFITGFLILFKYVNSHICFYSPVMLKVRNNK